ncbi:hypothetical protein [Sorangium sp. So ce1099]|uniref:hypothetical protein n=1 Tax=Sorangium sp. So ce1099 TaxID=3133331 RepID=UPI003F612D44
MTWPPTPAMDVVVSARRAPDSGRLSSRDGGGTERCLGLVVLLDVVLDLEMPVPPEVTEHPPDGVL